MVGEIAMYCLVVLIVTGVYLTFFFVPASNRVVYHGAGLIFLGSLVVHLSRVFFTGGFRRPREVNWIVGVTLLVLGMMNGFFGDSLRDDRLSGTGVRVGYSIALSIPVAGEWLAFL